MGTLHTADTVGRLARSTGFEVTSRLRGHVRTHLADLAAHESLPLERRREQQHQRVVELLALALARYEPTLGTASNDDSSWWGYRVGDRIASVRVQPARRRSSSWLVNEVYLDAASLDDSSMDRMLDRMARRPVRMLVGYAEKLMPLAARVVETERDDLDIHVAVSTGGPLTPTRKRALERAFGPRITSRYAANEFGVLAQRCRYDNYHLNTSTYVVEVLGPDDRPVTEVGEHGRVVVTDLLNTWVPLVRYDIGDRATVGPDSCRCGRPGPTLAAIDGRTLDAVRSVSGANVGSGVFAAFTATEHVGQWQFQQLDDGAYRVLIVPFGDDASLGGELEQMVRRLRCVLGTGADVEVMLVAAIPPLPSGKQQLIVDLRSGPRDDATAP